MMPNTTIPTMVLILPPETAEKIRPVIIASTKPQPSITCHKSWEFRSRSSEIERTTPARITQSFVGHHPILINQRFVRIGGRRRKGIYVKRAVTRVRFPLRGPKVEMQHVATDPIIVPNKQHLEMTQRIVKSESESHTPQRLSFLNRRTRDRSLRL